MKVGILVVSLVAASSAWAAPDGQSPESYFAVLPPAPKSVDEARPACASLPERQATLDKVIKALTPASGGSGTPSKQEIAFIGTFRELGRAQGEKIVAFAKTKTRLTDAFTACTRTDDHGDERGLHNRCFQTFLGAIQPAWIEYVNAVHDLVAVKSSYVGEWLPKAADPTFKQRLLTYRHGLWMHVGAVLDTWGEISCNAM